MRMNNVAMLGALALALFWVVLPTQARADGQYTTTLSTILSTGVSCSNNMPVCSPDDCTCIDNQMQCAQMKQAQDKSQIIGNFMDNVPKIDLATYNCLTKIDKLLDQTNSPSLAGSFLDGIIDSFIGQACNVALSSINQINNFTLSQINRLCIPGLSTALSPPNLGLTPASCNGTSLASFSGSSSSGSSTQPIYLQSTGYFTH